MVNICSFPVRYDIIDVQGKVNVIEIAVLTRYVSFNSFYQFRMSHEAFLVISLEDTVEKICWIFLFLIKKPLVKLRAGVIIVVVYKIVQHSFAVIIVAQIVVIAFIFEGFQRLQSL